MTAPPVTVLHTSRGSYKAEYARNPAAVATASPLSPLELVLELGQDSGHAGLSLGYGSRLREDQGRAGVGVREEAFEAFGLQKLVAMRARRRRRWRAVGDAPAKSLSARMPSRNTGALHAPTCAAARGRGGIYLVGRLRHGGAGWGMRLGVARVAVLRSARGRRVAGGRMFRVCVDMGGRRGTERPFI
jgi:hypothetical protein